jgi:hypothetical protein
MTLHEKLSAWAAGKPSVMALHIFGSRAVVTPALIPTLTWLLTSCPSTVQTSPS